MPSGIWMASSVVAEPSHPCGTLKVRISYAPASTVSSARLTCAWAVTALLRTSAAAPSSAPAPASRGLLVRRVLMVSLFLLGADPAVWSSSGSQRSWVDVGQARTAGAVLPLREQRLWCSFRSTHMDTLVAVGGAGRAGATDNPPLAQ